MMSYGAGGLAAAAGVAFCMQDACLKRRQIPGTCRLLPPIRTLETSMKRLLLVAFVLLLAGELIGRGVFYGLHMTVGMAVAS